MQHRSPKILVLVVDDEKQIADAVSRALEMAHFTVETFYDARLALARARDWQPDILVSDITMPDMDGITLAKALRDQYPKCKIIFISGNANWKRQGAFQDAGLAGAVLLFKPFKLTQLLSLIESM